MFIHIGIRKTRNTDDSLGSGTKFPLPSLSLGFLTQGERDTIFTWLTVSSEPTNMRTPHSKQLDRPQLDLNPNSLRLSPHLNSLLLFKITKNPSPSLPGMTSFPIWGFYCDICDCHFLSAGTWTPALMSAPTHALSRKVLSLTKLKDKTYKTKNDNIKKNPSGII